MKLVGLKVVPDPSVKTKSAANEPPELSHFLAHVIVALLQEESSGSWIVTLTLFENTSISVPSYNVAPT